MAFGIVDSIVFGFTLLASAGIGVYYRFTGGKQNTTQEYLLGSRNQKVIPIAFSLVASFASSISILGTSSEAYMFGTQFFVIVLSYIPSYILIIVVYLPVFYKLGTISVYQYLEKRFGKLTRVLASTAFIVQMILYMGIVHYAPALAMEAVTGISRRTLILAIGSVCIFYCTIGGLKAVVLTDLLQMLVMYAAVFSVIATALSKAGSFSELWKAAQLGGRVHFDNFSLDPTERTTWWSVLIGGMVTHLSLYGTNQTQVQRYVSMKEYGSVIKALIVSWLLLTLLQICLCLTGFSMYYIYRDCDPILTGRISSADQLMPLYVMEVLQEKHGLMGLFTAGLFSASLSTVSACVNSLAAVTLEDYVNPLCKNWKGKEINERSKSTISKMLALFYGVLCLAVALLAQNYASVLQAALTVFGVVGGPLLALFTLGLVAPCVKQPGAVLGLVCGLAFSFFIAFGGPKPPLMPLPGSVEGCYRTINGSAGSTPDFVSSLSNIKDENTYPYLFRISYLYYGVLGFLITVIVATFASVLFNAFSLSTSSFSSSEDQHLEYYAPFIANRLRRQRQRRRRHITNENSDVRLAQSSSFPMVHL